ncbi:hypothetical protein CC1G_08369 [Coprinopsis cinerea okayama7|uniref:Uncharacterized protein n=1 Tax=Coprinopsis cinerea (strain Okayama-7 / 130 / ATCC MYA-4618 / FGSC 9003) TaxID=240176 RepID=A8NAB3_COPC7|nr:hypothetical protein CC1G_08369 [Coprinopsis cinerea okayama7\|eukprot:XP_001831765.2 hypothetical protein CC1G_08369 [Coprinopsis cinerea okayama7\
MDGAEFENRWKNSKLGRDQAYYRASTRASPPTEFILPEFVHFKNPQGRYLKSVPNSIGWYGLKWDPTAPDLDCRFRVRQIPEEPGKFYVLGRASDDYRFCVSLYKSSGSTKIDDSKIIELTPTIAIEKVLENRTDADASQSVSYTYTKSEEGNWNNAAGIELGQGFTFKAGVPFITEAEVEVSVTEAYEHQWGGSTIESVEVQTSTSTVVPAHTTVKLTVLIYKSQLDIPFSYTERVTNFDGSVVEVKNKEGVYHNVQFIKDHATSDPIRRI